MHTATGRQYAYQLVVVWTCILYTPLVVIFKLCILLSSTMYRVVLEQYNIYTIARMDLINNIRIVATELVFQTTSSQYTYLHLPHVCHVRLSYSRMCCMHNIRVIHTHFYILYNVFLLSSTTTSCQYKLVCKYYSRVVHPLCILWILRSQ